MAGLQLKTLLPNYGVILLIWTSFIQEGVSVLDVPGYELYGRRNCFSHDIWQGNVANEAACATRCNNDDSCVGFVYYVYSTNPPQYCYTKSICDENALFWNTDLHTFIRLELTTEGTETTTETQTTAVEQTTEATSSLTSTPVADTTSDSQANNSTIQPFHFVPYTVPDVYESPSEAPKAVGIGVFMVLLLIVFVIFFVLLDLDGYYRAFKRGYRNLKHGLKKRCCCKSKKSGASDDDDDNEEKESQSDGSDLAEVTVVPSNDKEAGLNDPDKMNSVPSYNTRDETVLGGSTGRYQGQDMSDLFSSRQGGSSVGIRRTPKRLVKQLSRKSLVYHIEDVE